MKITKVIEISICRKEKTFSRQEMIYVILYLKKECNKTIPLSRYKDIHKYMYVYEYIYLNE